MALQPEVEEQAARAGGLLEELELEMDLDSAVVEPRETSAVLGAGQRPDRAALDASSPDQQILDGHREHPAAGAHVLHDLGGLDPSFEQIPSATGLHDHLQKDSAQLWQRRSPSAARLEPIGLGGPELTGAAAGELFAMVRHDGQAVTQPVHHAADERSDLLVAS